MGKRQDLLEKISEDDPNYTVVKRFYLEAWADSHALVADGFAGRLSLPEFVDGCVRTFAQGAEVHIRLKDDLPIGARCREIDRLAKKMTDKLRQRLGEVSDHLGETAVKDALRVFSRRVAEIRARSKQRILEASLAESEPPRKSEPLMIRVPDLARPRYYSTRAIQLGLLCSNRVDQIRVPKSTYEFPATFPQEAQRRFLAKRLRAESALEERRSSVQDFPTAEARLLQFVLELFVGFIEEGHQLGMQGRITAAELESECMKFLRCYAFEAGLMDGPIRALPNAEICDQMRSRIAASDEWKRYRELLQAVADTQAGRLLHLSPPENTRSSEAQTDPSTSSRTCVELLLQIVDRKNLTLEGWSQAHRFSRTTVYTWKACRLAGVSLAGKVSDEKSAAIEKAIETDAALLGFTTRTDSD